MIVLVEKLRRELALVQYVAFVFLGAAIILPMVFTLFDVLILTIAYFVVGIIYPFSISLGFQPKRIVSPIHVQLVTIPLVVAIVGDFILRRTSPFNWGFVTGPFIFSALTISSLIVISSAQTPILRYLVGLNRTMDDVSVASMLIHAKLDEVLKKNKKCSLSICLTHYIWRRDFALMYSCFVQGDLVDNNYFLWCAETLK